MTLEPYKIRYYKIYCVQRRIYVCLSVTIGFNPAIRVASLCVRFGPVRVSFQVPDLHPDDVVLNIQLIGHLRRSKSSFLTLRSFARWPGRPVLGAKRIAPLDRNNKPQHQQ